MWDYKCQTNSTISRCSVGCERMVGCKMSGRHESAKCAPDATQCACPAAMLPLVETMYWSCSGDHWEVEKKDWKDVVEAVGCSDADSGVHDTSALLAVLIVVHSASAWSVL